MTLCFDIGANVGEWSLKNMHNYMSIISIEASPNVFKTLKSRVNGSNINAINYAVCNNDLKPITFYEAGCNTLSTINKEWLTSKDSRFHGQQFREIIVNTITIDELINIYGKPDIIKIDVECGEYNTISSLSQKVNQLCFEWASETNNVTLKCLEHLVNLGFNTFYLQFEDNYTFRPNDSDYNTLEYVKTQLYSSIPKKDWGMVWCK